MAKRDNVDVIATALATVMRQSLNAPFRKECLLHLGVTNNRDAQDVIFTLLKSREKKYPLKGKENSPQDRLENENSDQLSCGSQHHPKSKQLLLEEALVTTADNESLQRAVSQQNTRGMDPLQGPGIKQDVIESVEQESDEEAQLDWDIEPRVTKML